MGLLLYAGYIGITTAGIIVIMRASYYIFVLRDDPIKAVCPPRLNWFQQNEEEKEQNRILQSMS